MSGIRAPSAQLLRAMRRSLAASHPAHYPGRQVAFTSRTNTRCLSTSKLHANEPTRTPNKHAPTHRNRGPKSTEDTQTDFGAMDVFNNVPTPATSIDACVSDGFHLDNNVKTEGGSGIILVGGEAFNWRPWDLGTEKKTIGSLLDTRKGILTFPRESLGLLELLHPKPDLLIIGTGARLWMLNQETRKYISEVLGCRIDIMDTANAAAAYNLLAKERGIEGGAGVGSLLLPVGWIGVKETIRKR